ncbi:MAG: GTP-binding protein [Candidatus Heimdallarchaeaceae archaeon]
MSKYINQIYSSMENKETIRNVSIVSHVDHGKTTLSDHLLQAGGLISKAMAGSARALDFLEEEQKRGITIKTANVSFNYDYNDSQYLINLVDTPGHVDFSGMVSQALRLVDGVIIVVDAVEQVMAQTESVIKQAMNEGLKPILFINKVDRLINELKLPKEEIETRLNNIIQMVSELISQYAPKQFKKRWKISFEEGTVIVGAALHGWAISKYSSVIPQFEKIIELHKNNNLDQLKANFPIIEAVMVAIIENIENPKKAQEQRYEYIIQFIDKIAKDAIINCDNSGPSILCLGKLLYEDNRGIIAVTRVFSGTVKSGTVLKNRRTGDASRIQQVCIYKGQSLIKMDSVSAGNIAILIGLKDIQIGDTFVDNKTDFPNILFNQIPYLQESVISRRIEPRRVSDIPKMQKIMDVLSLIKPNFQYTTDENTGEMKIHGIGELQLEIIIGEIEESGIYVEVSDPEVNLAEQIEKEVQLIKKDYLNLLQITAKCKPTNELEEGCIYSDHRENCLVVDTEKKDNEILDLFKIGFQNAVLKGPMKGFPIRNITMVVEKMEELSPDSLRYEIVIPLVRNILHEAIMNANPGIYEPIYSFSINTPIHYLGPVLTVVQRFGSSIGDTEHLVSRTIITGEISVESSLQIATELRSASEGYAFWQFEFQGYKRKK